MYGMMKISGFPPKSTLIGSVLGEERPDRGGGRGGFRGRGGRYAARGFAAAGLTRSTPRTNGEPREGTAAAA